MTITATAPRPTSTPTRHSTGLAGALNHEWDSELAHRAAPWSPDATEPQLPTAQDFLDALVAAGRDTARTDDLLLQMLRAGWAGDALASRAVLQTMLGAAMKLAQSARRRRIDDAEDLAIAAMWQAIANYPRHIEHKVAATLRMETLHRMHKPALRESAEQAAIPMGVHDYSDWVGGHGPDTHQGTNPSDQARTEATDLLRWAQDRTTLTDDQVQIVALRHLQDPTPSWASIAADLNITSATARQRYHRAVGVLAQAVQDRLGN